MKVDRDWIRTDDNILKINSNGKNNDIIYVNQETNGLEVRKTGTSIGNNLTINT